MKLCDGYKRLNDSYELVTDDYEYKMINGYVVSKKDKEEVVFDIYFRKVPTSGGYAIMAGLDKIIEYLILGGIFAGIGLAIKNFKGKRKKTELVQSYKESSVPEENQGNKFCTECGARLEEKDKFCPLCGAKVK